MGLRAALAFGRRPVGQVQVRRRPLQRAAHPPALLGPDADQAGVHRPGLRVAPPPAGVVRGHERVERRRAIVVGHALVPLEAGDALRRVRRHPGRLGVVPLGAEGRQVPLGVRSRNPRHVADLRVAVARLLEQLVAQRHPVLERVRQPVGVYAALPQPLLAVEEHRRRHRLRDAVQLPLERAHRHRRRPEVRQVEAPLALDQIVQRRQLARRRHRLNGVNPAPEGSRRIARHHLGGDLLGVLRAGVDDLHLPTALRLVEGEQRLVDRDPPGSVLLGARAPDLQLLAQARPPSPPAGPGSRRSPQRRGAGHRRCPSEAPSPSYARHRSLPLRSDRLRRTGHRHRGPPPLVK